MDLEEDLSEKPLLRHNPPMEIDLTASKYLVPSKLKPVGVNRRSVSNSNSSSFTLAEEGSGFGNNSQFGASSMMESVVVDASDTESLSSQDDAWEVAVSSYSLCHAIYLTFLIGDLRNDLIDLLAAVRV